jgi:hypothetical protein
MGVVIKIKVWFCLTLGDPGLTDLCGLSSCVCASEQSLGALTEIQAFSYRDRKGSDDCVSRDQKERLTLQRAEE